MRSRLIDLGVLRASATSTSPARSSSRSSPRPARSPSSTDASSAQQPASGHAVAPLPARSAPWGVERGGARRWRGDPLRVPHRRARPSTAPAFPTSPPPTAPPASPPITPRPSRVTGSPGCSSPTTTTPPATRRPQKLAAELMAERHRVLPGPLPLRRRRQRRGRGCDQTGRRPRPLCAGRRVDGSGDRPPVAEPVRSKVTTSGPKVTRNDSKVTLATPSRWAQVTPNRRG